MSRSSLHRRPIVRLLAGVALPAALLAGCAEAPQQTRSEQAQYNACREQVDRVVVAQNQDMLTQLDPVSSPYGASSTLTGATDGLVVRHQRDTMMSSCLNHIDSQPANTGSTSAYPSTAVSVAPITPPPADLAEPAGADLSKPPVLSSPN